MENTNEDPCEILPWDTTFWGFTIARVRDHSLTKENVRRIDDWCAREFVRCLYFLSRPDDLCTTSLAENNGFHLVDVRVTLQYRAREKMLDQVIHPVNGIIIRPARPKDVAVLQTIARDKYQCSRFYHDNNFPRDRCSALYETWIKVSCEGYADLVLVAELNGEAVGYITCHLDCGQPAGRIGLVAVDDRVQAMGVGRSLTIDALKWFQLRGVDDIFVVTQGRNYPALYLYNRVGFAISSIQLWYHKWYTSGEVIR